METTTPTASNLHQMIKARDNLRVTAGAVQFQDQQARGAAITAMFDAQQQITETPAQVEAIRPRSILDRILGR